MSKRATKRSIAGLLADRDATDELIAKYRAVMADIDDESTRMALHARMVEHVAARDTMQATAELLAVEIDAQKVTYSGRWLHRRGLP